MSDNETDLFDDIEFREGAQTAKETIGSGGSGARRIAFLDQLLDGSEAGKARGEDHVFLRYLTDYESLPEDGVLGWITLDTHRAVPTKPKPASEDSDRNWPKAMPAICRNDKALAAKLGDCWIHKNVKDKFKPKEAHNARPRMYAIAVLRQPVLGDGSEESGGARKKGKIVGFTDVEVEVPVFNEETNEVEKDDNGDVVTETVPQYVLISQAYKNYFRPFSTICENYGTALDRDYKVVCTEGKEKTDVEFTHIACDPIRIPPLEEGDDPVDFDMRDKELREMFYPDMPDLKKYLSRQASMEYYNKWFIPQDGDDEAGGESGGESGGEGAAKKRGTPGANESTLADMRERLKKRASAGAKS